MFSSRPRRDERQRRAARRAEATTLAGLAATIGQADPLAALVRHLRSTFGLDGVAILRRDDGGGWVVETSAGAPIPSTPRDATLTLRLAEEVVLVVVGRGLSADDRRVLDAFAAQLASVVDRDRLRAAAEQAAALGEANELRTALLQAVSHDLRTPLASIKASVSSLRQADVAWTEEEVKEFLTTIEEETDRLAGVVGNLLDMSRLQAGVLEPLLRSVGLEEVVPAALASLGHRAALVDTDVPEDLPPVRADPALLERVIANLVENALDASPPDERVLVCAGAIDGRVDLRVADKGPGIPPNQRDVVFQPFQRLDDRSSGSGVGLGLAVSRGFVQAMDGELVLDDTAGGGTTRS